MYERALEEIGRKFVRLMRSDPPPHQVPPREPLAPVFDRWVAKRFTADEVQVLFRVELECGERAIGEWFDEVLYQAGLVPVRAPIRTRDAA
jgi:hypothetical protein